MLSLMLPLFPLLSFGFALQKRVPDAEDSESGYDSPLLGLAHDCGCFLPFFKHHDVGGRNLYIWFDLDT
jgi:hypothetical protein